MIFRKRIIGSEGWGTGTQHEGRRETDHKLITIIRAPKNLFGEGGEVCLGNDTSAGVDRGLHLGDLRINVLHELDNEIHQLVLVHALSVEVGHQEGDIISLDGLTTENNEWLGALGQETHKLLGQQFLQFISLLDSNADTQGVDGSLNQNSLLLSTSNDHRVEQQFRRGARQNKIEQMSVTHTHKKKSAVRISLFNTLTHSPE